MGFVQEQRKKYNFQYRTNSVKTDDKILQYIYWPIFGPFPQFLGQKTFFLENLALSRTPLYGFLAPCQNLEK